MGLEFLACCVFAYYLVRHPELIGEAAAEWRAARNGEESPAAAARRRRLADAGVDPAAGGAFRQYAGNVWRDFWVDQDAQRAAHRTTQPGRPTATAGGGRGVFGRVRDAYDTAVDRRVRSWRDRNVGGPASESPGSGSYARPGPTAGQDNPTPRGGPEPPPPTAGEPESGFRGPRDGPHPRPEPEPRREPIRIEATVGPPTRPWQPATTIGDPHGQQLPLKPAQLRGFPTAGSSERMTDDEGDYDSPSYYARQRDYLQGNSRNYKHEMFGDCNEPDCHDDYCLTGQINQGAASHRTRTAEPIRAAATVGPAATPPAATAVLETEGETMSDLATRGTAVTGVVSGAAEARSIQRALEAATQAYDAAVASARRRIHSLGEQTVGVVQMAGRSDVVNATAQAAEAIASAQAGVNACRAEVIPLMGQVARHFDRRNS